MSILPRKLQKLLTDSGSLDEFHKKLIILNDRNDDVFDLLLSFVDLIVDFQDNEFKHLKKVQKQLKKKDKSIPALDLLIDFISICGLEKYKNKKAYKTKIFVERYSSQKRLDYSDIFIKTSIDDIVQPISFIKNNDKTNKIHSIRLDESKEIAIDFFRQYVSLLIAVIDSLKELFKN